MAAVLTYQDYRSAFAPAPRAQPALGDLRVLPGIFSPQLGNTRDLLVWLPPSCAEPSAIDRRYPVVYMQDGQNLFDEATSYAGSWGVAETMTALAAEGLEAIVVGVPNMGVDRLHEYGPFAEAGLSLGRGGPYVDFLAESVKPLIDSLFRTLPRREATAVLGSSLGGTISLYAFFERPDVFGAVGAMSPALQLGGWRMLRYLDERGFVPGRIYLDVGTHEGMRPRLSRFFLRPFARPYANRVRGAFRSLVRKGYRAGRDVVFVREKGGLHNERAWGRRLPQALRFLIGGRHSWGSSQRASTGQE